MSEIVKEGTNIQTNLVIIMKDGAQLKFSKLSSGLETAHQLIMNMVESIQSKRLSGEIIYPIKSHRKYSLDGR